MARRSLSVDGRSRRGWRTLRCRSLRLLTVHGRGDDKYTRNVQAEKIGFFSQVACLFCHRTFPMLDTRLLIGFEGAILLSALLEDKHSTAARCGFVSCYSRPPSKSSVKL